MKKALSRAHVLTEWLGRVGLTFVDIGGRGAAFPPLASLAPFADYFVSEPDAAEAARLSDTLVGQSDWRTVTVLNEAMASQSGDATLWITEQPGMSSLLEPDPRVTSRFYLGPKFAVANKQMVPTTSLDAAAKRYGFEDACFLKVDTQGTELDILRSGAALVEGPLVGVHVETLFQPFYKGQSLFADVDQHLRAHGFSLFLLSRTSLRRAGYRPDLYSKRVVAWAHCLYLREPATLLEAEPAIQARQTPRLLVLALAFQLFDLAFELVELSRRLKLLPDADVDRLFREVHSFARIHLRQTLSKAERAEPENLADLMLSPSLRDKKRIE
jgi:FkbM family methyltransferase